MLEKRIVLWIGVAVLATATLWTLLHTTRPPDSTGMAVAARGSTVRRGTYGGDLEFLRQFHTPPHVPGESNHYIDLWTPGALPILARVNGLTNNHALIVDSHGKAGCSRLGSGYGFYPRTVLLKPGSKTPYYSAADLAQVIGPTASAQIHNILLAGCNAEGRLRSQDFRKHFPNATNITYMTPGQLAFKPMFYQALVLPETAIRQLYGLPRTSPGGQVECVVLSEPEPGAQPLGAYVADLFLPGAQKPFQTRKAARELLAPKP